MRKDPRHEHVDGRNQILGPTEVRSKSPDQQRKRVVRRQETESMRDRNQEKTKKGSGKETKENNTKTMGFGACPKTSTRD